MRFSLQRFSPLHGSANWDVAKGEKLWNYQRSTVENACAKRVETDLFIYLDVGTQMTLRWVFLSRCVCRAVPPARPGG